MITVPPFFLLYNLFVIMVFTTIYFLVREYFRISGDKLNGKQAFIVGIIIGSVAMLIEMFVPIWYPGVGLDNQIQVQILTIIPLYIIIFTIMFDSRFAISVGFLALFGILLRIPLNADPNAIQPILPIDIIEDSILEFISIISAMIIVVTCQTMNLFKRDNNHPKRIIYIFGIWIVIFEILVILIYGLDQIGNNNEFKFTIVLTPFLFFLFYYTGVLILQFIFILLIEKVYTNSDILKTFSTKDETSFYKISLSQQTIKQNIIENNISMAAMVLFYLEDIPQTKKEETLTKIRTNFLTINSNSVFFKATSKSYAAFIPMKIDFQSLEDIYQNNAISNRKKDDPLYKVDKIIADLNKDGYPITCGISLYGIHSYNIPDLISKAEMILGESSRINNLTKTIVYDYRRIRNNLINNTKIAKLSSIISKRTDAFVASINLKNFYYVIHYFKIDDKHFELGQILENINHSDRIFLQRFLAYQTLRENKEKDIKKLVLSYPIEFLNNEDFNANKIIRHIAKQISPTKIILEFDSNLLIKSVAVKNALKALRDGGIEFSISDAEKAKKANVAFINPDYYMFSKMINLKKTLIVGRPDYKLKFPINAKEIK